MATAMLPATPLAFTPGAGAALKNGRLVAPEGALVVGLGDVWCGGEQPEG